jgi:pimeloyl-ACP methyl ester carboxylesterase
LPGRKGSSETRRTPATARHNSTKPARSLDAREALPSQRPEIIMLSTLPLRARRRSPRSPRARGPLALALSLSAALGACAEDAPPPRGAELPQTPTPGSTPCEGAVAPCLGTLTVPLDRSGADPGTIEVGYRFVPARKGRAEHTVAYFTGGPGFAAIDESDVIEQFFGPVLDDANLLVMDYRGVGKSSPLRCPSLRDPSGDLAQRPSADDVAACAASLAPRGLPHFGTAAAADDLEDLRVALGLGPLDLFGTSYGVFAAEVFAARHPAAVRSAVLHGGVLATDQRDPWLARRFAALPSQSLDLACARADCGNGEVAASQIWRQAVGAIRRGEVEGLALADAVLLHRYATGDAGILDLARAASALVTDGDSAPLVALAEALREPPGDDQGSGDDVGDSRALFLNVLCNDFAVPFDRAATPAERRVQLDAAWAALPADTFDPFTKDEWRALQTPLALLCVDWTPRLAIDPPAAPAAASAPLLFVAPELDAASTEAAFFSAQYPAGQILEVELGTHGAAFESACAGDAVRRFLTTGKAEPQRCAGE